MGQCRRRWPSIEPALRQCLVWVPGCHPALIYKYIVVIWPPPRRNRWIHAPKSWFTISMASHLPPPPLYYSNIMAQEILQMTLLHSQRIQNSNPDPGCLGYCCTIPQGRGPGSVVKAACLESRRSRVLTPLWPSIFKETNVSSPLTRIDSIFVGNLRDREVACSTSKFRILCLEGSVIEPPSGGSPGLV